MKYFFVILIFKKTKISSFESQFYFVFEGDFW